jgi:hypothetical protein
LNEGEVYIGVHWGAFPNMPVMPVDVAQGRLPADAANLRVARIVGRRAPGSADPPRMAFTLRVTQEIAPGQEMLADWLEVTPPVEVVGAALAAAGAPLPIGYELGPDGGVRLVVRDRPMPDLESLRLPGFMQPAPAEQQQQGPQAPRACAACGTGDATFMRCGRCRSTMYCSKDCQKDDWPRHKEECVAVSEQ